MASRIAPLTLLSMDARVRLPSIASQLCHKSYSYMPSTHPLASLCLSLFTCKCRCESLLSRVIVKLR